MVQTWDHVYVLAPYSKSPQDIQQESFSLRCTSQSEIWIKIESIGIWDRGEGVVTLAWGRVLRSEAVRCAPNQKFKMDETYTN